MSTKSLVKNEPFFPTTFDEFFRPWNDWFTNGGIRTRMLTMPAVNVNENEKQFTIMLAAPGLKKEDFKIDVNEKWLTISSEKEEKEEKKEDNYSRREYSYQSFSRTFSLPEGIDQDKINASYENGELKLVIPKKQESKKIASKR